MVLNCFYLSQSGQRFSNPDITFECVVGNAKVN